MEIVNTKIISISKHHARPGLVLVSFNEINDGILPSINTWLDQKEQVKLFEALNHCLGWHELYMFDIPFDLEINEDMYPVSIKTHEGEVIR